MLASAGSPQPYYALWRLTRSPWPRASTAARSTAPVRSAAVSRARAEALSPARNWVSSQPTTRGRTRRWWMPTSWPGTTPAPGRGGPVPADRPGRIPSSPFVEARIRFASGDVDARRAELKIALDTVAPQDFRRYQGAPTVIGDIAAAANVFAYQGDLVSAAKALDLADQVRDGGHPGARNAGREPASWRPLALGDLYAATGVPTRRAPPGLAERRRGGALGAGRAAEAHRAQRCRGGASVSSPGRPQTARAQREPGDERRRR